jgi:hypothetical protein
MPFKAGVSECVLVFDTKKVKCEKVIKKGEKFCFCILLKPLSILTFRLNNDCQNSVSFGVSNGVSKRVCLALF